ncbi:hypothetical protein CHARACLAT_024762 [Characodon lateralis]|uniref:Uncharacterized protein n=1 Tax=Characodon lateralis TaxID=208331 RepID=A0ABU7DBN3_9TELE|nr:hypothetical protein [Characodon lateralis]
MLRQTAVRAPAAVPTNWLPARLNSTGSAPLTRRRTWRCTEEAGCAKPFKGRFQDSGPKTALVRCQL